MTNITKSPRYKSSSRFPSMIVAIIATIILSACSHTSELDQVEAAPNTFSDSRQLASLVTSDKLDEPVTYFSKNSSSVTREAARILDQQAIWIVENSVSGIVVSGHADERGTRNYNLALSAKRGQSVLNYLVSRGVPREIIRVRAYGKELPVEDCSSEKCWEKNRRVETTAVGVRS